MTYFELKDKPDQYFRKIVGINKLVFNEILNILLDHQNLKNTTGGRPYKMSIEDRISKNWRTTSVTYNIIKRNSSYWKIKSY
ncbi:hypothetical protein [Spiroplasma endosymbiont of Melieria omissa]|uniref:hypothetical protein n=1 Tax=Spiroplasma endosymbiont of Melieria omissa TaxID=3139324 RepID=UPI003CCA94DE